MLAVADAQRRLLARIRPTSEERVALSHAAGRVLARDVVSSRRLPGADNSAMDGYAVIAADVAGAGPESPVMLPLNGEARAGAPVQDHTPGAAMAIATGGALPRGADAIVRVEDTALRGDAVEIRVAVDPGTAVRRAGSDVEPGATMIAAGRRIRAVDIAACAAVGAAELVVRRRPRVAVLSSGDEIVPVEVEPAPHQVVDSNGPMLAAAVAEAGGEPVAIGVVRDEADAVRDALERAAECDLIVSSAGVSVGPHDHVRAAVEQLGSVDVWRIAVRPGKPLLLGEVRGTPLLGLPGNPVSSAVTFELFGRPAILALQAAQRVHRRRIAVRLAEDLVTPESLETYVRVRLDRGEDAIPLARASGPQGSSMLRSLADADALAVVPAGTARALAESVLEALEIN